MAYRIPVDENLDPETADLLRTSGHDVGTVGETLGKGANDSDIAAYARERDRLVLTNDTHFHRPPLRGGLTVLYTTGHARPAHETANGVRELAELVPDQADLPSVTRVG